MARHAAGIFILLRLVNRFLSAEIPSVTSGLGIMIGETKNVIFQKKTLEVDTYLGIPYAKPPTGELRLKMPEPYGPFSEPYRATDFGPACPQSFFLPIQPEEETSEDCLFLNIYVPRQEPDQRSGHAVMFFIHGGAFTMGSGSFYDGGVLSSMRNVLVVTINYRLGLLGFLDIDNEKSSGNFGLFDQRLALQWINENIHAFGGDKDRVTIFGESAGAVSVSLQMIYPANEGLFRSGISQSGALALPGLYQENNIEVAKYVAENISCSVETMDEVFSCLQSARSEDIIKVVADAMTSAGIAALAKVGTAPTVDGEFITTNPTDLYTKAQTEDCKEINFFRSLKLMNGVNGKEGAMFLMMLGDSDKLDELEITREQMNTQQIPGAMEIVYGHRTAPEVVKQLLIAEYTDWENPDDPKKLREQVVRLFGDINFNVPAIEMSRIHSNASDVDSYFYNFAPLLQKPVFPTPHWINVSNHGDELGPVFGYNLDYALMNISDFTPPEWELELSKRMMTYWTNFAKTGNPNRPVSEAVSSVVWPKYDVKSQSYMKIDREDSIGQYLFARETDFWRTVSVVFDATEHVQTITSQYGGRKDDQTCDKDGICG